MKKCLKDSWFLLPLLLITFFVPLVFSSSFFNIFELPKALLFRAGIAVSLVLAAVFLFREKSYVWYPARLKSPVFLIMTGLGVVFYFSTLLSDASILSFYGSYLRQIGFLQWLYFYLFFAILTLFLSKKFFKWFLTLLIASGFLISVYGVFQYLGKDFLLSSYGRGGLASVVMGTLSHPNFLAQFLAPMVPITFAFGFSLKGWKKYVLFFIAGLFLITTFFTYSRGAFVGLIFASVLFLLWMFFRSKIRLRKKLIIVLLALLIAIFGLMTFKHRVSLESQNLRSLNSRIQMWEASVDHWSNHPVLGTGMATFALYFPEYVDEDFYYYEQGLDFNTDRPHNDFFETLVSGGVIGVGLYLGLFVYCLYLFFFKRRDVFSLGLLLGYFVYFGQNQFSFSMVSHWIVFGIILVGIIVNDKDKEDLVKLSSIKVLFSAMILILIGTSMIYLHVWKPAYADVLFKRHNDFYEDGVIEEAISLAPYNSYYHYSILEDGFGGYENIEAIKLIEGNATQSMLWEAHVLASSDSDRSEVIFKDLIFINPNNSEFLFDYARFLYDDERYEESVFYFEKFLKVVPEFWKWKFELNEKTDYEVAQYEIFFRNSNNFKDVFKYLVEACERSGQYEKSKQYLPYEQDLG